MTDRTPTTAAGRALATPTLCDHPCTARVLDSGGWSCRRCEQFCEPPCPTCASPAPLDEHRGLTVDEWAVHLRSCSGCAARWAALEEPTDD
jgi:hypothetical protein